MIDTPCIIFAGGKSSRMGEDKALLPFGDFSTLTEFQLYRLKKIFKNVYISCKDKTKFDFEASFIEDIKTAEEIYAPTTGFVAIFQKFKIQKIFVISVDTPFVGNKEIKELFENDGEEYDATIAKTKEGIQPLCGIYHRSLEQSFQDMLHKDNHKLGFLLKNSKTNYIFFEKSSLFMNLNRKEEYFDALKLSF